MKMPEKIQNLFVSCISIDIKCAFLQSNIKSTFYQDKLELFVAPRDHQCTILQEAIMELHLLQIEHDLDKQVTVRTENYSFQINL